VKKPGVPIVQNAKPELSGTHGKRSHLSEIKGAGHTYGKMNSLLIKDGTKWLLRLLLLAMM
jgi:hypothetical protein